MNVMERNKMNTQELAEKLAMKAAGKIVFPVYCNRTVEKSILSTIPLVELLECVEALRFELTCLEQEGAEISAKKCRSLLCALDAKLGGKV
jgi:hypothetical protein